ncbi:hypothetical protein ADK76_25845 [Streptomyces griseoflavus]|nr:hypothetical protein ADK76_25845 [Streptomyces griseoflavus]
MTGSSFRAVVTITGTSLTARSIRSTWAPSTSGSPRSRTTRSGRSVTAASRPDIPVAAVATAAEHAHQRSAQQGIVLDEEEMGHVRHRSQVHSVRGR